MTKETEIRIESRTAVGALYVDQEPSAAAQGRDKQRATWRRCDEGVATLGDAQNSAMASGEACMYHLPDGNAFYSGKHVCVDILCIL